MGFKEFRETMTCLHNAPGEEMKRKAKENKKPVERLWHVRNQNMRKSEHRTAAELWTESHGQGQGFETVQTVLDMRGPIMKVLTKLDSLNEDQSAMLDDKPMPELQHNIGLIVQRVQAEIPSNGNKLAHGRDTVVVLEKETEQLQNEYTAQEEQVRRLEAITNLVQNLQENLPVGVVGLESIAASFSTIKSKYREEYDMYDVGSIVLWFLMPIVTAFFRDWTPLQNPQHGVEIIYLLQKLLEDREEQEHGIFVNGDFLKRGMAAPYTKLVMEAVIPAVRMAATSSWEPRDPEPMLSFFEVWEKFLPPAVLHHFLDNFLMPKLAVAVESWDPRMETVPIHAWLHPWLPLLGSRMEVLYPPIRYKLTTALRAWHPRDTSAHTLLSPWQAVFDAGSWEQLLVRSILPKLMFALQELVINPAQQLLDQFNWVMAWAAAMPIHHMAGILETYFFPKWQRILYQWLCSNPNFEEVTRWYLGWKSVFPSELLANERIRRQLNVALDMMNQAVDGAPVVQPGARENVSYLRVTEQREYESNQHARFQIQHLMSNSHVAKNNEAESMSLKEIVEVFAQQSDVQFTPRGRLHEGLQVYGFGLVSMCIDSVKQMILAQKNDKWVSVTLEQLLEIHRSRSGSRWK
jgi:tuftelin-interacting protein 11